MSRKKFCLAGFGVLLVFVALVSAHADPIREYELRERSNIRFSASTPLFSFRGRAGRISGRLFFAHEPALKIGPGTRISVPVRAITTGIDRRDQDFYRLMQADSFPAVVFQADTVASKDLDPAGVLGSGEREDSRDRPRTELSGPSKKSENDGPEPGIRTGVVYGTFEISGETRRVRVPVVLVSDTDTVRIRTRFTLDIRDFGLETPSLYIMDVNPTVDLTVDLKTRRLE